MKIQICVATALLLMHAYAGHAQDSLAANDHSESIAAASDSADHESSATDDSANTPATESARETEATIVNRVSSGIVVVRETKDTVYVAKGDDIEGFMKRSRRKVGFLREKGFGIAGGPLPGVFAVSMSPVRELTDKTAPFAGKHFHFGPLDYRPMQMHGGMGYLGLGNSLRMGGGGCGGKTEITSSAYQGDSVLVLDAHVGFGGFLIEKGFVRDRLNLDLGGYIGGGNYRVTVKAVDLNSVTAFEIDGDGGDVSGELKAGFMLLEAHGGFTYTITSFFHVGMNLSLPAFISANGFSSPGITYSSEFFTLNPGVQVRIMFGNLG